jgi:hypothetical protein
LHSHAPLAAAESEFISQPEHSEDPGEAKVLAGQEAQESSGDIVYPEGQVEHSETEEAPIRGKCLPAAQATQVPFTAGHLIQLFAPSISEYVPRPQLMHLSAEKAPSTVEYLPALHLRHELSPSPPLNGKYFPAGHRVQVSLEDAPSTSEYVPMPQFRHVSAEIAPCAVEYLPALHFTHNPS